MLIVLALYFLRKITYIFFDFFRNSSFVIPFHHCCFWLRLHTFWLIILFFPRPLFTEIEILFLLSHLYTPHIIDRTHRSIVLLTYRQWPLITRYNLVGLFLHLFGECRLVTISRKLTMKIARVAGVHTSINSTAKTLHQSTYFIKFSCWHLSIWPLISIHIGYRSTKFTL